MISGVYMILNVKNNKVYIGHSSAVKQRIRNHKDMLKRQKHYSIGLQKDFDEYGMDAFVFNILDAYEQSTKAERVEREMYWISFYRDQTNHTIYNISDGGNSVSQETRQKIRLANLGDKNPKYWLGKNRSEETKKKQSETMKGRMAGENHPMWGKEGYWKGKKRPLEFSQVISEKLKGHTVSEEGRKKMSDAKKGKDPHNKFPLTPELLKDIENGISYIDFEVKYGKSKNTLKRIKRDLQGKPPRVRADRKK